MEYAVCTELVQKMRLQKRVYPATRHQRCTPGSPASCAHTDNGIFGQLISGAMNFFCLVICHNTVENKKKKKNRLGCQYYTGGQALLDKYIHRMQIPFQSEYCPIPMLEKPTALDRFANSIRNYSIQGSNLYLASPISLKVLKVLMVNTVCSVARICVVRYLCRPTEIV